jgi:hypothetical protein
LYYSGRPLTFTAQNTVNTASSSSSNSAQLVGNMPGNGAQRIGNGVVYFGNSLTQVVDPSVAFYANATLKSNTTLKAIADASGNPILVNPLPGAMGFLPDGLFRGPGAKVTNMNLLKRIKITERITMQLGASADNITNTPTFGDPTTSINSVNFGRITSSSNERVIVLQGRVNF